MAEQQSPGIFRQQALEHLSTPEQLDQLLQVTTRKSWVPILALGGGLVAAVVWSIVGTIPVAVEGEGVLVFPAKLVPFQAPASGQITALDVEEKDIVSKGQVLGRISQPELLQRLKQEQSRLAELVAQDEVLLKLHEKRMNLEKGSIERDRRRLKRRIETVQSAAERRKAKSDEFFARQRENITELNQITAKLAKDFQDEYDRWVELFKDKDATEVEVHKAHRDLSDSRVKLADVRLRMHEVELQRIEDERAYQQQMNLVADLQFELDELEVKLAKINQLWEERKSDSELRIQEVRASVERCQKEFEAKGLIVCEHSGRVSGVAAAVGQIVDVGARLGFIATQDSGDELMAVVYYDMKDGKQIGKKMIAHISPSMLPRERHGSIIGTVTSVSDYAVTTDAVTHVVGNPEVARRLTATGNKIQVLVSIEKDPSSSQVMWTSGRAPDENITEGTTVSVRTMVKSRRPITYVIPLLKEWSGS
jgi:HlyD family secretion protein